VPDTGVLISSLISHIESEPRPSIGERDCLWILNLRTLSGDLTSSPPTQEWGAIHGIGAQFSTTPVTETRSLTIPLPVRPGRRGCSPSPSFGYSSAAPNGSLNFARTFGLHSVTWTTDKDRTRHRNNRKPHAYNLCWDGISTWRKRTSSRQNLRTALSQARSSALKGGGERYMASPKDRATSSPV
jgi:Salmonella virulence plasmid 65kDa B protein